jgi:hemerythrin-like domain-containing protein
MSCMCNCKNAGPMDMLKNEHRVIERVLDALERNLSNPVDAAFYRQAIDFLRNFADGCHHAKEENELFPVLESAGIPREMGPIGCMLNEHEIGRALIRKIEASIDAAAAGDAQALASLRQAATNYIQLLRNHISKEDNVLFVMADRALGPEEQELLRSAFHRADQANACSSRHEYYVELADKLMRDAA